jgi:hypothetical protein
MQEKVKESDRTLTTFSSRYMLLLSAAGVARDAWLWEHARLINQAVWLVQYRTLLER